MKSILILKSVFLKLCLDALWQAVATVIQLQGAVAADRTRTRPLGVVCCIADPNTAGILDEVRS